MRKPNCSCLRCEKLIYRRPYQLESGNVYCSKQCYREGNVRISKLCQECDGVFQPKNTGQIYCSKKCATTKIRRESFWSTSKAYEKHNKTKRRLVQLEQNFGFTSCMVEGCEYSTTYDIHRYIPGNQGGEYEIGNMFAICPNHHAEVTRNIVEFEKVSDCILRVLKK